MEKQRRLKVIILSILITGILSLTIAFATLSRTLNINGIGKMDTASWDVRFESLKEAKIVRDAIEIDKPSIIDNGTIVGGINVKLTKPKDEISYKVDITNNGTIDAEVNFMTLSDLSEEEKKLIDFGVYYLDGSKITKYDLLEPGDKKTIIIKIRYKDDITEKDLPSNPLIINLSCRIEYIQSDAQMVITPESNLENVTSILAQTSSYNDTFSNSKIKKQQIESISFMNTLKVPNDAQSTAVDSSYYKDGSVVSWYTDLDNNDLYEVYIGGNKKVHAPSDSQFLFSGLSNLREINFNNIFVTSDVISMANMFSYNVKLENIDLSSFNTEKVKNMSFMFYRCSSLTSLDLSNFDTSSVTNMKSMFCQSASLVNLYLNNLNTSSVTNMSSMFQECSSLTSLDLSNFDTSNVTNMKSMFQNCDAAEFLNLSSFNTSSVTDMSSMFGGCEKLNKIYFNNATFDSVTDSSHMFLYVLKCTIYVKDVETKEFILNQKSNANVIIGVPMTFGNDYLYNKMLLFL